MKCPECKNTTLVNTKENHLYIESGLKNVTLRSIPIRHCSNCGIRFVSIPKIADLHRCISLVLIKKPNRLAPSEIRFLRKYLGWSGADFARKFHCTPQQVSRWESERVKARMSISNELLLRSLVACGEKIDDYQAHMEKIAVKETYRPQVLAMQRIKEAWAAA